jgi:hypothetical protein
MKDIKTILKNVKTDLEVITTVVMFISGAAGVRLFTWTWRI